VENVSTARVRGKLRLPRTLAADILQNQLGGTQQPVPANKMDINEAFARDPSEVS
jgi:hypothetical protein